MADIVDQAQHAAALFHAAALAGLPPVPTGPAALVCMDCGEPIPKARRLVMPGATCRTFCQDRRESQR